MRIEVDAAAFARLMTNLLPTGDAWPTEPGSVQQQVILALSSTFAALNARANYLITDAFPGTSVEMLPEWEKSVGLPDACSPLGQTVLSRQRAVVAKLVARGGASIPYFISVAAALGATVTVTQFTAFRADSGCADDPDYDDVWAYVWRVEMTTPVVEYPFYVDTSHADEPLDVFETSTVECRLRQIAPADTVLIFNYSPGNGVGLTGADGVDLDGTDAEHLTNQWFYRP